MIKHLRKPIFLIILVGMALEVYKMLFNRFFLFVDLVLIGFLLFFLLEIIIFFTNKKQKKFLYFEFLKIAPNILVYILYLFPIFACVLLHYINKLFISKIYIIENHLNTIYLFVALTMIVFLAILKLMDSSMNIGKEKKKKIQAKKKTQKKKK